MLAVGVVALIGGVVLVRSGSVNKAGAKRRAKVRDRALDMLADEGWIDTWELAKEFGVPQPTIQRVIYEFQDVGEIPPEEQWGEPLDSGRDDSAPPARPAPSAPPGPPAVPPPLPVPTATVSDTGDIWTDVEQELSADDHSVAESTEQPGPICCGRPTSEITGAGATDPRRHFMCDTCRRTFQVG